MADINGASYGSEARLTLKQHCEPQGLDLLGITYIAGATVNVWDMFWVILE